MEKTFPAPLAGCRLRRVALEKQLLLYLCAFPLFILSGLRSGAGILDAEQPPCSFPHTRLFFSSNFLYSICVQSAVHFLSRLAVFVFLHQHPPHLMGGRLSRVLYSLDFAGVFLHTSPVRETTPFSFLFFHIFGQGLSTQ